jgi:hypothetical protein
VNYNAKKRKEMKNLHTKTKLTVLVHYLIGRSLLCVLISSLPSLVHCLFVLPLSTGFGWVLLTQRGMLLWMVDGCWRLRLRRELLLQLCLLMVQYRKGQSLVGGATCCCSMASAERVAGVREEVTVVVNLN